MCRSPSWNLTKHMEVDEHQMENILMVVHLVFVISCVNKNVCIYIYIDIFIFTNLTFILAACFSSFTELKHSQEEKLIANALAIG